MNVTKKLPSPSREHAFEIGAPRFIGNTCQISKDHGNVRYTINGACVECAKQNCRRSVNKKRAQYKQSSWEAKIDRSAKLIDKEIEYLLSIKKQLVDQKKEDKK